MNDKKVVLLVVGLLGLAVLIVASALAIVLVQHPDNVGVSDAFIGIGTTSLGALAAILATTRTSDTLTPVYAPASVAPAPAVSVEPVVVTPSLATGG